jgi:hypothetical protein
LPQNHSRFKDVGPAVVMASPGMLQNGFSRQLFEQWCPDARNGLVVAGYCVEVRGRRPGGYFFIALCIFSFFQTKHANMPRGVGRARWPRRC